MYLIIFYVYFFLIEVHLSIALINENNGFHKKIRISVK